MNPKPIDIKSVSRDWIELFNNRSDDIDPDDEYDWEGVLVGFLIGRGVSISEAKDIGCKAPTKLFPI